MIAPNINFPKCFPSTFVGLIIHAWFTSASDGFIPPPVTASTGWSSQGRDIAAVHAKRLEPKELHLVMIMMTTVAMMGLMQPV